MITLRHIRNRHPQKPGERTGQTQDEIGNVIIAASGNGYYGPEEELAGLEIVLGWLFGFEQGGIRMITVEEANGLISRARIFG